MFLLKEKTSVTSYFVEDERKNPEFALPEETKVMVLTVCREDFGKRLSKDDPVVDKDKSDFCSLLSIVDTQFFHDNFPGMKWMSRFGVFRSSSIHLSSLLYVSPMLLSTPDLARSILSLTSSF